MNWYADFKDLKGFFTQSLTRLKYLYLDVKSSKNAILKERKAN